VKNAFLSGDKIYLRPLEYADAPTMVGWMNDPDVTRTLQIFRPMNEQSERDFIDRVTKDTNQVGFAIVSRRDDQFVGTAGLMSIDWRDRHAAFGISIGDKTKWGLGYGTEATMLLTEFAFETLNLHRVWLHVYDFNAGGLRAYERAGYRREGVLREAAFREGRYHDVIVMAVLRDEWRAARRTTARAAAERMDGKPARSRRAKRTPPRRAGSRAR